MSCTGCHVVEDTAGKSYCQTCGRAIGCNCPEAGTSGNCPYHDVWTVCEAFRQFWANPPEVHEFVE